MRRVAWGVAFAVAACGAAAAQGYWRGGVYVGAGPYSYHPPPTPVVASEGCYAGAWVCPLERPAYVGAPCACATGQGTVWGQAR